jgi:hypothetical protein
VKTGKGRDIKESFEMIREMLNSAIGKRRVIVGLYSFLTLFIIFSI